MFIDFFHKMYSKLPLSSALSIIIWNIKTFSNIWSYVVVLDYYRNLWKKFKALDYVDCKIIICEVQLKEFLCLAQLCRGGNIQLWELKPLGSLVMLITCMPIFRDIERV